MFTSAAGPWHTAATAPPRSWMARAARAKSVLSGKSHIAPWPPAILPWAFTPEPKSYTPGAQVRCAQDHLALITLARAGVGLTQIYDFLVEREVERGLLVEVLREYRGASRPFSLVYPQAPKRSAAARALIDHLLAGRARTS